MARKAPIIFITALVSAAFAAASSFIAQALARRAFMAYLGVNFEPELTAYEGAISFTIWLGLAVFLISLPLYAGFIWRRLKRLAPAAD